ncbi:MAG: response regulator [Campylobacterota bacterium]|nr:response regulator [Campylobacterota bacterium]
MFGFLKSKTSEVSTQETTGFDIIEKYTLEIKNVNIENQPFRLSGMLHILTNKIGDLLQANRQSIYYDIKREIGRYIIGDNDYLEQVLEILVKNALSLNRDSEVILKISKIKTSFLIFEVFNEKGMMQKEEYANYLDATRLLTKHTQQLNAFIKAKKIAEMMKGSIEVTSKRRVGTQFTLKIPYYADEEKKSHQDALKASLQGQRALFIVKDMHHTQQIEYIFETYGITIVTMNLEDFEKKKPDLRHYNMAIVRSADLNYKHVSFFKTIYQNPKSNFKIIIMHELFESEDTMMLSKSIAHAEIYNPAIIGDVEEILYQMFIRKSNAVKGISNMEIFDPDTFTIKGRKNTKVSDDNLDWYKGAHIAIVEDSKVDQRVIKNILNIDGVTLFCLNNGEEMLQILETEEIDIIFSDINMPVMDGLLMTQSIRAKKRWEHIPIISISSMAFAHEVEEMKVAGMNATISKPIEANEVYAALDNFLVMTAQIRNRKTDKQQIKFLINKEIIDINRGLEEAVSALQYQEDLLKTLNLLDETRASFEKMIYDQQFRALAQYARISLERYKKIYATEMIQMFTEFIDFISQKQKVYVMDYIYLYQQKWTRLKKEVEKYIQNIENLT